MDHTSFFPEALDRKTVMYSCPNVGSQKFCLSSPKKNKHIKLIDFSYIRDSRKTMHEIRSKQKYCFENFPLNDLIFSLKDLNKAPILVSPIKGRPFCYVLFILNSSLLISLARITHQKLFLHPILYLVQRKR